MITLSREASSSSDNGQLLRPKKKLRVGLPIGACPQCGQIDCPHAPSQANPSASCPNVGSGAAASGAVAEAADPCWSGYEMAGTKKKNGKTVPNCIPAKESVSTSQRESVSVCKMCGGTNCPVMKEKTREGGPGSGDRNHAGRKGEVGGSGAGGGDGVSIHQSGDDAMIARDVAKIDATKKKVGNFFKKAFDLGESNRMINVTPYHIKEVLTLHPRFLEANFDAVSRTAQVVIADQGVGNARDGHYYGGDTITQAAKDKVFEGAQAYADHPSLDEDVNRPERSIRDLVGYYYDTHVTQVTKDDGSRVPALAATLKIQEGADWALGLIKEAIAYNARFPKLTYMGISINADGDVAPATVDGSQVNYVHRITRVFSADMVTKPARGGKFLALVESASGNRQSRQENNVKGTLLEAAKRLSTQIASGQIDEGDLKLVIAEALKESAAPADLQEAKNKFMEDMDEADKKKFGGMNEAEQSKWMGAAKEAGFVPFKKGENSKSDQADSADDDSAGPDAEDMPMKKKKEAAAEATPELREAFPSLYATALKEARANVNSNLAELQKQNAELKAGFAMRESVDMAHAKLAESSLPASAGAKLMHSLIGKQASEMDKLIEAETNYLRDIGFENGKRVGGNGARSVSVRESMAENNAFVFAGLED